MPVLRQSGDGPPDRHRQRQEEGDCTCARQCAEKQQLLKQQELNLSAILQTVIGQHLGPLTDELARLTCPACGIKYMEFRAEGRLGCPHDYEVFRAGLEPLLQRIHRATRHVGKAPRHGRPRRTPGRTEWSSCASSCGRPWTPKITKRPPACAT